MSYENALFQWEEGLHRIKDSSPRERVLLEHITDEIVAELRRRLGGGSFTTAELAEFYYSQSTDWCLGIAMRIAPDSPAMWSEQIITDAAFGRYVREASDFAGGQRRG